MNSRPAGSRENCKEAAESISAALDFLRSEAEAAGLPQVAESIRRAAIQAYDASHEGRPALALADACRAIVRLPRDYRSALVYRKVYRRSCAQIADGCGISQTDARLRVSRGFQLVRDALQDQAGS